MLSNFGFPCSFKKKEFHWMTHCITVWIPKPFNVCSVHIKWVYSVHWNVVFLTFFFYFRNMISSSIYCCSYLWQIFADDRDHAMFWNPSLWLTLPYITVFWPRAGKLWRKTLKRLKCAQCKIVLLAQSVENMEHSFRMAIRTTDHSIQT